MQIFHVIFHWVWTALFSLLLISGLAMTGARFGWILQYDIAAADLIHRIAAVFYVLFAFFMVVYEAIRVLVSGKNLPWSIFGASPYGRFTIITTILFIVSGIVLWGNHNQNKAALAFSMFVHEKLTYFILLSLLWHIYEKAHTLLWPAKIPHLTNPLTAVGLLNQPWAKLAVWLITSSFFFAFMAVVVAGVGPPPSERQVGAFMKGMMQAMNGSLMGIAADDPGVGWIAGLSSILLVGTLILAIALAIFGLRKEGSR